MAGSDLGMDSGMQDTLPPHMPCWLSEDAGQHLPDNGPQEAGGQVVFSGAALPGDS